MVTLVCEWCKNSFQRKRLNKKNGMVQRFCGLSCSGRWLASQSEHMAMMRKKVYDNPKVKKNQSEAMKKRMTDPNSTTRVGMLAYANSNRNPFRNPDTARRIRAKALATQRLSGWAHLNGGNGTGPSKPQAILHAALGWPMEVTIKTSRGYHPGHYKIDLAEASLKIAIEVDGHGHLAQKVKAADRRKEVFLTKNGWKVLRFTNREILGDLPSVMVKIASYIT